MRFGHLDDPRFAAELDAPGGGERQDRLGLVGTVDRCDDRPVEPAGGDVWSNHEDRPEDPFEQFLRHAAEQRRRAAPAVRRDHDGDLGVLFDLAADDLSDAFGGHVYMGRHVHPGGVVLLETFGQARFCFAGIVFVEHDLDDIDRGVAASCELDCDVDCSPRGVGAVDRDDQVLNHGVSLR